MDRKRKEREEYAKTVKIFQLAKLIYNTPYISLNRIAEQIEISERTAQRYIERLRDDYNAPIKYDRFNNGYYYTDPTFFFENSFLKESDVFAIAGILPLLERYNNTPLEKTIKSVYETVSNMLPNKVKVNSTLLQDVQFISDPIAEVDADIFNSVFKNVNSHTTISFRYKSIKSTDYVMHTMDPYRIYSQKGDWYVVGFSHERNKYSTYTLSRMKDIIEKESFDPDPDYEKKVHIDPNFGIWNNDDPPEKIELLFDKGINTYILERTWHKNQECRQNEDGSVYLSFTSNQSQEILYWIMKFGSQVKVLSPASLRDKVLDELKKAIDLYS